MLAAQAVAREGDLLSEETIHNTLAAGLSGKFTGARVLALIPDHTRTLPLPQLFRLLVEVLSDVKKLDFMVALGTHQPLSEEALLKLVGITRDQRVTRYHHVGLLNHAWSDAHALMQIGTIPEDQVREIAGPAFHPSLSGDVPVRINRRVQDYDHIIVVGPTFPHEVVGMSGGAKYFFPGISGPEMINKTHWLGALITTMKIIGIKETPVRAMIHAAAGFITTPVTLLGLVVKGHGLAGMFIGSLFEAFNAAADLSARTHIRWVDKPFRRVLSWAQPKYDELWTGAKAMYKLEPAVADGGELIIYAPHLDTISHVHGDYLYEVGYHVLPYFLEQWDRFKHVPTGVLAHSTHVKGLGTYSAGIETPRIQVTLASQLSRADTERVNLRYEDPADINLDEWRDHEADGILFVPEAGEQLYRVRA